MVSERFVLVSKCVRRWTLRAVFVVVTITVTLMPAAPPAQAQTTTITVENLTDSGAGSLRAAITQSASTPAGQSTLINFASGLSGTILLGSTLSICNGQTLTIQGPTASQIALSGQNQVPVFNLCGGTNVTISDLTIESGLGDTIDIASAPYIGGGGIQNAGGLTVTKSTFLGNSSGSSAGGASATGGAILNLGTLTVTNSTFSGNSAPGGGGIANWGGLLAVANTTVSGNAGGGIADNTPDGSDDIRLKSTLLAGNTGGNCISPNIYAGDQGYNLSDDGSCNFSQPSDMSNTPAGLDPKGLGNNGGPTESIALLSTSPAVDAIPVANCTDTNGNPVTTDQRGVSRPQGKACDIGAYELIQGVPFTSFQADLLILTGKPYGYSVTALFTPGAGSTGITPATQTVILQIASYSITIPAGSFKPVGKGSNAPYTYEGTVNGVTTGVLITPLGGNRYGVEAAASSVNLVSATNPVTVTLMIGGNTGTTTVNPIRLP
jgi:hypothetical protein